MESMIIGLGVVVICIVVQVVTSRSYRKRNKIKYIDIYKD